MPKSIILFRRTTVQVPTERFNRIARRLGIRGETHACEEALAMRDERRALAYAQPSGKLAGLLFFGDQTNAWAEPVARPLNPKRAEIWTNRFLKEFGLWPKPARDEHVQLDVSLRAVETAAVVFDGKTRKRVKAKTDLTSTIVLNSVPVTGPRSKVRAVFKQSESPVMLHCCLWETLSLYEERELVREHEVVNVVKEKLSSRSDGRDKSYDIRDVRLVYYADEYAGGPDLLRPFYFVELELRDPMAKGKSLVQGPRQVIRVPAFR